MLAGRLFADTGGGFPGQIPWGKTKEEIQRITQEDPDPALSKGDVLAFRSKAFGEDVVLEYAFRGDRLVEVRCLFAKYLEGRKDGHGADPGQCIQDYLRIRKRLTKRYGQPQETAAATSREEGKALEVFSEVKDLRRLGSMEEAIRKGAALWYTSWKAEGTLAILLLTGGQGAIRLEVRCSPLEASEVADPGTLPREE